MARSRKFQQSLKHLKLYSEQTPVCLRLFSWPLTCNLDELNSCERRLQWKRRSSR
jgi:hypothetical protein